MCGITGFIDHNCKRDKGLRILRTMTNSLVHRGPDDQGGWFEEGVGLGHSRLAILDLSPEGHQPMVSNNRRYALSYNGEIYNYRELRLELEKSGMSFKGSSDTEVILACIEKWGLEHSINRFIGMFAFALFDKQDKKLFLVRDRLGIKPLYYGYNNEVFLFSSELKAIRKHPEFSGQINREAILLLLQYSYIPSPHSIYKNVKKLLPGHILIVDMHNKASLSYRLQDYWILDSVVENGLKNPFRGSVEEAIESLENLLCDSVNLRMVSDVPIGAFLSGGIDSSLVTSLMQAQSKQPVKTFTIGFHELKYDEAKYAKAVANHLGTDHTELYVSPEKAMSVIPKLPLIYDEPFSDSSQIPTILVSQLARNNVTVVLSGDGGDELFYGYSRYFFAAKVYQKYNMIPNGMRRLISKIIYKSGMQKYRKLKLVAEVLSLDTKEEFYNRITTAWKDPACVVTGVDGNITNILDKRYLVGNLDLPNYMMYLDQITYLPDDILVKMDRASMAVGLEARVPLLDHRVVEFSWSLPLNLKLHNGQSKWALRQVLYKYLPSTIFDRSKMGFGVPIDSWLRGPLRDWAEDLLDENRMKQEGYFNPQPIREKWKEHLSGMHNWHYYLWHVLMFQAWLQFNKNSN